MQGSINYCPWATSGLLPMFVNKVLCEHSPTPLLQQSLVVMTETVSLTKPKIIYYLGLCSKGIERPWYRENGIQSTTICLRNYKSSI